MNRDSPENGRPGSAGQRIVKHGVTRFPGALKMPCSRASQPGQITPQLIFGLLILFVGVVFTLDALGVTPAVSYLRYWPLAIVAVGLIKLIQAKDGGGALTGLIITVLGSWLLAEELDLINIDLRHVWPVGLVLFGVYLVWQGLRPRTPKPVVMPPEPDPFAPLPPLDDFSHESPWKASETPAADASRASETARVEDAPRVGDPPRAGETPRAGDMPPASGPRTRRNNSRMNVMAIMGGVSRGNNSTAFRGADLLAIMGGLEIDLRKAAIHGEAVIDLFVMWGGIEIRVPEDWTVTSHVVPLMGGVEDKTRPPQMAHAPHQLVLRGVALMGGVEIKN
jgi:predicted membrane protein